jgi:hypothetical protein
MFLQDDNVCIAHRQHLLHVEALDLVLHALVVLLQLVDQWLLLLPLCSEVMQLLRKLLELAIDNVFFPHQSVLPKKVR